MNSAELNSLKKQMVIKLGTTTNDESAIISNMVDGASAGALPVVSADDNGKVLKVVDGVWTKAEGGGGGGVSNPVLTINVDGTGIPAQEQGAIPLFSINNGVLQKVNTAVSGGALYSYETIVTEEVYPGDENYFVWNGDDSYPQITGTSRTLSVSNAINCQIQLDQENHRFMVMVENGTQPASFTLTIS